MSCGSDLESNGQEFPRQSAGCGWCVNRVMTMNKSCQLPKQLYWLQKIPYTMLLGKVSVHCKEIKTSTKRNVNDFYFIKT